MSPHDFDAVVEAYRVALKAFVKGDPEPVLNLFSRREDVTLANPLGPPQVGRANVELASRAAAANFKDGSIRFEEVSRYAAPDLGYVVDVQRVDVQLADSDDTSVIALRVTTIFRREGDTWMVAHRHADPITTARPISTLIQT
jgi:ketosteroid isomerase-like protein